ncbi:MAG: sulfotransferase, partial [Pseudomonadota bacterium]
GFKARQRDRDYLRGRLLNVQGRYDEAFAGFKAANSATLRAEPELREKNRRLIRTITAMRDEFTPSVCAGWQDAQAPAPFTLVWHVGFNRSGTTLLDQMLQTHPNVTVLEEQDTLGLVVQLMQQLPGGYPACLQQMDDETAKKFRAIYLTQLQARVGPLQGGHVYVDKMPMNTIHLGLAARLVPDARVLFSLRHPVDVCLSCYMQPLALNPFNRCFLSLDDTAALYTATMQLYQRYQTCLALPQLQVRYEALVEDLEGVAREVFAFLEQPFIPSVLAFHEHASRREVVTCSYDQVVKPLYGSAVGRWQAYRDHLTPWLPILQEFVDAFGYTLAVGDAVDQNKASSAPPPHSQDEQATDERPY